MKIVREPLSVKETLDFALYHVEKAAYDSFRLEMIKPHWTVSFVLEGSVEMRSSGMTSHAETGDVMIHPPNVPFTEIAVGRGVHLWMLLDVKGEPQLDFFRRFPVGRVVTLQCAEAYAHSFEELLDVWHRPQTPVRDYRAMSLSLRLLGDILDSWLETEGAGRAASTMTTGDRFYPVIAYMEEHLEQRITRDDLARMLHLHPNYFNRLFKRVYGVSSQQMLRTLRLRRAMQLLENEDYTLDRIAAACGFGDAVYFSKVFKSSVGRTPGEYRRSIRKTKEGYASFP